MIVTAYGSDGGSGADGGGGGGRDVDVGDGIVVEIAVVMW